MWHWFRTRQWSPGSCCRPASGTHLGSCSLLRERFICCSCGNCWQMLTTVLQLPMRLSVRSSCLKLAAVMDSLPSGPCMQEQTGHSHALLQLLPYGPISWCRSAVQTVLLMVASPGPQRCSVHAHEHLTPQTPARSICSMCRMQVAHH